MKSSPLILVLLASVAVAQEVKRQRMDRPPVNINPSQAISPINPSQTNAPIHPRQAVPPASRINQGGKDRPDAPRAAPSSPDRNAQPLTARIFDSITRGPNVLQGLPSMGNAGLPVENLRVETIRGRVVLSGTARTEWDKAEAGRRAEALAGQGNVVNGLLVRP